VIAQAACVTDVKKSFAIPVPRGPLYVNRWDEENEPYRVPAEAIVALILAAR